MTMISKDKRARFHKLKTLKGVSTARTLAVIDKLKAWRRTNGLSQRQAAEVMKSHGVPATLTTLQRWEIGARDPGKFALAALDQFMDAHPTVTDAPRVGRWNKPTPDDRVDKIRALREQGATLLSIAQKFHISESSVSRICSGQRRK
jgi:transcriptional regulator with XRE-family HTH domain